MVDKVEWRVLWEDEHGVWHNACDGAQSLLGLTAAEKLAKQLGAPWQVRHRTTMLTPAEHAAQSPPTFGSQWAP
jgi:hypothetical protein